ncbi:MAG: methyltransferase domain-containing protein [Candidatus Pacebacteria bacterium]|nr:methyltransferase domain-containing protein [Candidatus Paceibacterota bacterium]
MSTQYSEQFYVRQKTGSLPSAEIIVPHLLSIIGPVKNVVDVGCGLGTWLSVFKTHGASNILGVDNPYAKRTQTYIPDNAFLSADLELPLQVRDQFDLAVTLEVAEHIEEAHAEQFVASLTKLAPIVLFSAAIPGQGGTHHVNEQWPDYWEALFAQHQYVAVDCIRRAIWNHPNVSYWYAQNTLLYVHKSKYANLALKQEHMLQTQPALRLVHPALYDSINPRNNISRKLLLLSLITSFLRRT